MTGVQTCALPIFVASLAVLLGFAAQAEGVRLVLPGVLAASIAAMAVDVPILRYRSRKWHFPDGALLTGLIVAMVLSPHEPWWIAAVTSAVAVVSKYVMRVGKANVFNPAAFALVATFYAFDAGHSWWGSLPEAATAEAAALPARSAAEDEAHGALLSLGYKPAEVVKMLQDLDATRLTTEQLIREALRRVYRERAAEP